MLSRSASVVMGLTHGSRRLTVWLLIPADRPWLSTPASLALPSSWRIWVNSPETLAEINALRTCVRKALPFGHDEWVRSTTVRLGLETSLKAKGKLKKTPASFLSLSTCAFDPRRALLLRRVQRESSSGPALFKKSGGTRTLTITLNPGVTTEDVQAFLRSFTFSSKKFDTARKNLGRQISVTVSDQTKTSNILTTQIRANKK